MKDRRQWIVALALVLALFGIYGQTYTHEFLNFDDDDYLLDRPQVMGGLTREGFVWAFGYHAGNWHPLTWLSHMLDAELFGTWAGGHHVLSAGLHAANAVLLFTVLARLTGGLWRSAAVAALFALHPLRVESVAWAAERKDVLCALFWMLTLLAYLRHARRPGAGRYLTALTAFALGLAAKPMLVSLPFVLVLLDWWPLGRFRAGGSGSGAAAPARVSRTPLGPLLLEKAPFAALALVSSLVTIRAQTEGLLPLISVEFPLRLSNALVSTLAYLWQFFWPANLAVLYPYPLSGIPWWATAGSLGFLASVSAAVLLARLRAPFLLVGWLWYVGTLIPVLGIVQVGAQARADRYTYLTLIGIVVGLVWLTDQAWPRTSRARGALAAVAVAVLVALGSVSAGQAARWKDSLTLMSHTVRVTRDNFTILNNLGSALIAARRFDEAVVTLREAVRIESDHCNAHYNLGIALTSLAHSRDVLAVGSRQDSRSGGGSGDPARYRDAVAANDRALECYRRSGTDMRYVADTLFNLAGISLYLGRYPEAERHLRELLLIDPAHPGGRTQLNIVLAAQGKPRP